MEDTYQYVMYTSTVVHCLKARMKVALLETPTLLIGK